MTQGGSALKNQTMARVFAVVLAVLGILLILSGREALQDTKEDTRKREATAARYETRIATFRELEEKVQNSVSYDEASAALTQLREKHSKGASQHRTDTALYTAERGGYTMGANMIWEMLPELEDAKKQLKTASEQLDGLEKAYGAVKTDVEDVSGSAQYDEESCRQEAAALEEYANRLTALLQQEPRLPEDFVLPAEPGEAPQEPTEPALPLPVPPEGERPQEPEPYEGEDPEEQRAYAEALLVWQAAMEPWLAYDAEQAAYDAAWAEYEAGKAALAQYEADKAAYEEARQILAEQEAAHALWLETLKQEAAGFPLPDGIEALSRLGGDLNALAARAKEIVATFNSFSDSFGGMGLSDAGIDMGAVDLGPFGDLIALRDRDFSAMTPEELCETARTVAEALRALASRFHSIQDVFTEIDALFAKARGLMDYALEMLEKGEGEVHSQLANIWYHLGELDKQAEELGTEKQALDAESVLLSKRLIENDEMKELRSRFIGTRQILLNVAQVKAMAEESGDIPGSAEKYLASYRAETQRLEKLWKLFAALSIASGAAALLGIPAAFEKLKSRFALYFPLLVCLAGTIAMEVVASMVGMQLFDKILPGFTAAIVLLQLLAVRPQRNLS